MKLSSSGTIQKSPKHSKELLLKKWPSDSGCGGSGGGGGHRGSIVPVCDLSVLAVTVAALLTHLVLNDAAAFLYCDPAEVIKDSPASPVPLKKGVVIKRLTDHCHNGHGGALVGWFDSSSGNMGGKTALFFFFFLRILALKCLKPVKISKVQGTMAQRAKVLSCSSFIPVLEHVGIFT